MTGGCWLPQGHRGQPPDRALALTTSQSNLPVKVDLSVLAQPTLSLLGRLRTW
jgi:hypothetical protein